MFRAIKLLSKGNFTVEIIARLAKEFGISEKRVEDTVALIDEGNTIPFIAPVTSLR